MESRSYPTSPLPASPLSSRAKTAAGTTDKELDLPEDVMRLKGHTRSINNVAVVPGGEYIVSASNDGAAILFSVTGKKKQSFEGHRGFVYGVEAIDANTIVTVSADRIVRVWRLSDGKLLSLAPVGEDTTSCASLGSGRLLVGGWNGGLYELQWNGLRLTGRSSVLNAHSGQIRRISVCGQRFATASRDRSAKLWDSGTLRCVASLVGHTNYVTCVALNDRFVVTGSSDKTLRVYDAKSFRFLRAIAAHEHWIREVYFVDNGNAVLSGSEDETVAVHSLRSCACRWRMRVGVKINSCLVLSDGRVAACGGVPYDLRVFSTPLCKDFYQVAQGSQLATAFACAISDPTVLDESLLLKHIRPDNIRSVADLLAGHNLVLLAVRVGIITRENIHTFGGHSWYLKDNLYTPATKITSENAKLIHFVFHHAESLGIISGGYALKMAQEIRTDVAADAKAITRAMGVLSQRVTALEGRVSALEGNVDKLHAALSRMHTNQKTLKDSVLSLSRNLTDLQAAMRSQNKKMKYAGVARCLLSFIPVIGSAVGNATYSAAEVLMNLTPEHLVSAGADVAKSLVTGMAQVDLSNFQVARYLFSKDGIERLERPAKKAIMQAISSSGFHTPEALQTALLEHITSMGNLEPSKALLGSESESSLTGPHAGSSSSDPSELLDERARKYFQVLASSLGEQVLPVPKATIEINKLLGMCDNLSEVSEDDLEEIFFDLAREDEEDVTEDLFVRMFRTVRDKQEKSELRSRILDECMERFRRQKMNEHSLSFRIAARILRNVYRELEGRGFVNAGCSLELSQRVLELYRFSSSGNESVDEDGFLNALKSFVTHN